ncbi:MAG: hypothetical protein GVY22_05510 [Gammaproteobacteria bacterium]|jgi:hypothetical protein|nr:hypothetical protein [Gammaproteobacteria bacterium]
MQANLDPQDFKQTVKDALVELLTEEPAVLRDLFAEALEDAVFADAIREGRTTPMTTRESMLEVLEGAG